MSSAPAAPTRFSATSQQGTNSAVGAVSLLTGGGVLRSPARPHHRRLRSLRSHYPMAVAASARRENGRSSCPDGPAATKGWPQRRTSGAPIAIAGYQLGGSHRTKSPRGIAAPVFQLRGAAASSKAPSTESWHRTDAQLILARSAEYSSRSRHRKARAGGSFFPSSGRGAEDLMCPRRRFLVAQITFSS